MRLPYVFAVGAVLTLHLGTTRAGIISVSGDLSEISAPSSVQPGALQNDVNGVIFLERSSFTLPSTVSVDIDGTLGTYDEAADLTGGSVASGTTIDSYLLHFDPAFGNVNYVGSVQFDAAIVGLIVQTLSLGASDALLGASGTTYPTTGIPRRGLDLTDFTVLDSVTLPNSMTLEFDVVAGNQIDHIRVLTATASVPEASTMWLMIVATLPFVWLARRSPSLTSQLKWPAA